MSGHLLEVGGSQWNSDPGAGGNRKEKAVWRPSLQKNWRGVVLLLACFDGFSAGAASFGSTNVAPLRMARKDLPVLTRVAQVRALSPEEPARGYPVKLQAGGTFLN